MNRIIAVAFFGLALLTAGLPPTPAAAQSSLPPLRPHWNVDFAYVPPDDLALLATMRRLKERRVLEQISEFLSPLRLPHPFFLTARQCDVVNAYYYPDAWSIDLCYEFVEDVRKKMASKRNTPVEGMSYEDIVVGAIAGVLIHEMGHAVFDMLNVPMFGREEDAADAAAVFIALQFNKDVARTIVRSAAYLFIEWNWIPQDWSEYSDEHGTDPQRVYNMLCLAYGGDPESFKDFVARGWLPKSRADNCPTEYAQTREAFIKTILPFVDREKLKAVQAREWLKPTGTITGPPVEPPLR